MKEATATAIKWKLEPRFKWVLIRQQQAEEKKSDGGVILPGEDFFMSPGAKSSRGVVVKAAEGVDLKEGDLVLFTNFAIKLAGMEELTGDPDLKLVRDEEVYCVVKRCT